MLRLRHLLFVALGISAASTVSCTAIFAPRDDVQRCGTADDCDSTGDNRYVAECRFDDENVDLDTTQVDKICVAAYAAPGCDPTSYSAAFQELYAGYADSPTHYNPMGMTCAELGGVQGCPVDPMTGVCAEGLTPNEDGICDDGNDNTPKAYNVGFADEGLEYRGQDVLDQACRAYFCDDRFVCDTTQFKCVRCDPDLPLSQGGCGQVYIGGAPSCVYQTADQLDNGCPAPDSDIEKTKFGC